MVLSDVANFMDGDWLHCEKNLTQVFKVLEAILGKTKNVPWITLPAKDGFMP